MNQILHARKNIWKGRKEMKFRKLTSLLLSAVALFLFSFTVLANASHMDQEEYGEREFNMNEVLDNYNACAQDNVAGTASESVVSAGAINSKSTKSEKSETVDLSWTYLNGQKLLSKVEVSDNCFEYIYDNNNQRIEKINGKKVTWFEYDDAGHMVAENRDGCLISYQYANDEELGDYVRGFTLDGQTYTFQKDENQTVTKILNNSGEVIVEYKYEDGIVNQVLGLNENGVWEDRSSESDFIGNLNMIRLFSYYYDAESGLYYCGRYYDSINDRFADGINEVLTEVRPVQTYSLARDVDDEVDYLMSNANYGKPIPYSSTWYSGLTTTELLARLIFGENTSYSPDQNAIGYCLLNRYYGNDGYTSYYGNTMKEIATQKSQFTALTGDSKGTYNARQPSTNSVGWIHATYIAASIVLSDNSISECEKLFYRPAYMDYQTQFLRYSSFKGNSVNGNGCIKYKGNELKDVIIPDVGTYTNLEDLADAYANGFKGESNIHFGYK